MRGFIIVMIWHASTVEKHEIQYPLYIEQEHIIISVCEIIHPR